nr:low molecular weight protein tyrosine phosphatase family protein [Shinella curvata]
MSTLSCPAAITAGHGHRKSGPVKNVLFICSQNKLRSPTAEQVFADWPGIETSSAGTNNDADNPLSAEEIEWANIVFVMEKAHRSKVQARYRRALNGKRLICLDIPDDYVFMDPALIELLKAKVPPHL